MNRIWTAARDEFPFIAALPALLWQLVFLVIPAVVMLAMSFISHSPSWWPTLEHYRQLLGGCYFRLMLNSYFLGIVTVFGCLCAAFPVAYFVTFHVKEHRTLLLVLLMVPSWTNFMVRIYSWFLLLERDGVLCKFLHVVGLLAPSDHLLGTFTAVIIGMVYCYMPFMILPMYTSLASIDRRLLEASADLGATQLQTFRRVILPLALPGILTGSLIVFLSAFGEYAIPEVLGSSRNAYWGSAIADQIMVLRDFRSAAALTFFGVCTLLLSAGVISAVFVLLRRFLRMRPLLRVSKEKVE